MVDCQHKDMLNFLLFGERADHDPLELFGHLIGGQPDAGALWRDEGGGGGARWSIQPTPAGQLLNWMHGAGERRWVVGNGGRILRSDGGGAWEEVESGTEEDLWGVWAASADEAWAVGGDPLADPPAPTLLLQLLLPLLRQPQP